MAREAAPLSSPSVNLRSVCDSPLAMHAQIAEVFEIADVVLARIQLNGASPRASWRCIFAQHHLAIPADGDTWVEISAPAAEADPTGQPRRRRIVPGTTPASMGSTYLAALAGDVAHNLARGMPILVSVLAGEVEVERRTLQIQHLDPSRLQNSALRSALSEALRRSGAVEIAAVLGAVAAVEPIDHIGSFGLQKAVLANTGMVVRGFLNGLEHREIQLASADLRSWTNRSQITKHVIPVDDIEDASDGAPVLPSRTRLGFTAVLPAPSGQKPEAIYLVATDSSGTSATLYGPVPVDGPSSEEDGVRLVHEAFGPVQALPPLQIREVYRPVLARPQGAARARRFEFGPPVDDTAPLTSIIIPFYGDPFFLNCVFHLQRVLGSGFELILVVDDPRIWPEMYGRLSASSAAITVPTLLLECDQNYGYARANNLGAMAARGDVLVLMNSDILILNPAMLGEAATRIRAQRKVSAPEAVIGFSLLYEDDTIQHMGMEFPNSRLVGGLRLADHPGKGLPFALHENREPRQVPAVTGALMALSARLFQELGGLDAAYERGDFEDADLCLRARQMGAEIWLHVGPGLYHLERQSIRQMSDVDTRQMITYMNCVTFNERWDAVLSAQTRRKDSLPEDTPTTRRTVKLQPGKAASDSKRNLRSIGQ